MNMVLLSEDPLLHVACPLLRCFLRAVLSFLSSLREAHRGTYSEPESTHCSYTRMLMYQLLPRNLPIRRSLVVTGKSPVGLYLGTILESLVRPPACWLTMGASKRLSAVPSP